MLQSTKRYWGEYVSADSASSLSLCQLHQLARERAALRKPSREDNSVAVDVKEELPMVTQAVSGMTSAAVHHKLPDWISSPRLVSADIADDSAPLDSLALPDVVSGNLRDMGCSTFFPVQLDVLSYLTAPSSPLPPRDVLVSAPTGCGKTLCYVVPIVTALLDCVVRQVRCVVVVPSRPLAKQVLSVFRQVTAHTRVQCGLLCGDSLVEKEATLLGNTSFPASSNVDVVIATPGRLAEHLSRGSFVSLQFLRYLVIDEADKLLSQQIYSWLPLLLLKATTTSQSEATPTSLNSPSTWLRNINERISCPSSSPSISPCISGTSFKCARQLSSPQRQGHVQKLLLSATMTQDPEALAMLKLHRPLLFSVAVPHAGRETISLAPPPSLQEFAVTCMPSLKPLVLVFLLSRELGISNHTSSSSPQQSATASRHVLCFTNSRDTAGRLKVVLEHFDLFRVAVVTSETSAGERRRALRQFAMGEVKVMVCSDSLARGMDLPVCSCVVSYESPSLYRSYLHRVGRTARAGSAGRAFSLLSSGEEVTEFRRMLRVARRPRIGEEDVPSELLAPLRGQYELALAALRDSVSCR
ncbi:ATP-dependent RNA helicase DDX51 [Geodia barretti]|nr:ATP-dependent RNA helicase DDX51 [Geodia barretti]